MLDINKKKIMTRLEKLRRRHMEEAREFNRDLKFLISSIEDSIDIEVEQELKRQGWIKENEEKKCYDTANLITDKINNFLDKFNIDKDCIDEYIAVFEDYDFAANEVVNDFDELVMLFQDAYCSFEILKLRVYADNKYRTLIIKEGD